MWSFLGKLTFTLSWSLWTPGYSGVLRGHQGAAARNHPYYSNTEAFYHQEQNSVVTMETVIRLIPSY